MKNSSLWIVLQRMRLPFTVIAISYAIAITGLVIIPGADDQGDPYYFSIFEAFYFVTYTATTIGFGEIPYPFTHAQKIWVSISIYLTVIGWFYGIGSLVALLQDKLLISELAMARFRRSVRNIKEDFVIVLGYNDTTSQIIRTMIDENMRVVVIEKDQQRADYLMLEGFVPHVPVLVSDVHTTSSLEDAGIKSIHCKGIISLFESNVLNLRVTLASRILNPHIKVAVKATTLNESENLYDAGANIVENPFSIIASQIRMALEGPSLFKLENWLYNIDTLDTKTFVIPQSDIIICGYGRLGENLYEVFEKKEIYPTIIEQNSVKVARAKHNGVKNIIKGNGEDKYILKEANIKNAKLIIVATNDDTINLSIISTVKRLNKKTIIITRENELSDFSIFSNAKIDHIFLPSQILIHKTANAIMNPLCDRMIKIINHKDEKWGVSLLRQLLKTINSDPLTFELNITKHEAIEVYNYLLNKQNKMMIKSLILSRRDRHMLNNAVPLLIIREEKDIILPNLNFELQCEDKILFACDENAKNDLEYVINNVYEFHYIVTGIEKKYFDKFISRG
ncbi:MAG: NAD-binding protein [Campylobacterota bacterium]|nr:NAD-binding protein [Campylobacterota bacterium]